MQHCEQDTLALLALGEPAASPEDDRHLAGCSYCQAELAGLRAVVMVSRETTPADRPVSPPPAVWDRITAELAIKANHPAAGLAVVTEPAVVPPPVTRLADHRVARARRRVPALVAAAAVVGILAGVVGTGLFNARETSGTVVTATTQLKPLSVADASGDAALHRGVNGQTLSVEITGLRHVPDGFYEVWLADKATKKMVSVGVLDSTDHGSFDVPAGLNLAEYRVVDVSLEVFDGNPLHSAISVVRGTFPA